MFLMQCFWRRWEDFYRLGEAGSIQIQMRALKELADTIMRPISIICEKNIRIERDSRKKKKSLTLHLSLKILIRGLGESGQPHGSP